MDILLYIFIGLFILTFLSVGLMAFSKCEKYKQIGFIIGAITGIIIAFISYISLPSNYITQKYLILFGLSILIFSIWLKVVKKNTPAFIFLSLSIGMLLAFCVS